MEVLYQGSFFSTVKRVHGGELLAETFFISTAFEAVGWLRVGLKSFEIKEARWDIYRSPDNSLNGGRNSPELKGVEAYFKVGGDLRRAVGGVGGGLPQELLAECIRGIIQAETFVFAERGYPTARAYEEFWKKTYLNSCRKYSNLDRVIQSWYDHVGDCTRNGCLFTRNKSCSVYRQPDGSLMATGGFSDSFHELSVCLSIAGIGGVITACTGNFLRAPDPVCFENVDHLASLIGKDIANLSKKELAKDTGGPQGCNHLVDIIYDTGKAVAAAKQKESS